MKQLARAYGTALIGGLVVGAIVFALAYTQEQFWNELISFDPDWAVAVGMAAVAFVVTFVAVLMGF